MSVTFTRWARLRVIMAGLGLACCGLVLAGRFFQLQIIQGSTLREELDREVKKCAPSSRCGIITDRNGVELAISTQTSSLVAHPGQIKNPNLMSKELSGVIGMPVAELKRMLTRAKPFVFVKRCLTPEKEEAFRAWKDQTESRVQAAGKRRSGPTRRRFTSSPRPGATTLSSGWPAPSWVSVTSTATAWRAWKAISTKNLYGKPKRCVNMTDARGNVVISGEKAFDPDVMGNNLVLTIDRTIQYVAEKELQKAVDHWNAAGGMVMVTNPQTGEILAMAQVPRMDPNMPGHFPKEARHIRILTDAVEPGSAFKVFVVASALDAGAVKPCDRYNCENGCWQVGPQELFMMSTPTAASPSSRSSRSPATSARPRSAAGWDPRAWMTICEPSASGPKPAFNSPAKLPAS